MQKMILFVSLALISVMSQAQIKGAEIKVDKELHDFGTIQQNGAAECYFTITNTGNEPLIISEAKGSCQCTVPEYPKEPIMPGTSQKIKVKYNSSRVGPINKSVTITSNAQENSVLIVRIKGNVEASQGGGAPIKTAETPNEK